MMIGKSYDQEKLEREEKTKKYKNFQNWFAWYPVLLVDGRTAWLCKVERRGYWGWPLDKTWNWVYREIEKGDKNG